MRRPPTEVSLQMGAEAAEAFKDQGARRSKTLATVAAGLEVAPEMLQVVSTTDELVNGQRCTVVKMRMLDSGEEDPPGEQAALEMARKKRGELSQWGTLMRKPVRESAGDVGRAVAASLEVRSSQVRVVSAAQAGTMPLEVTLLANGHFSKELAVPGVRGGLSKLVASKLYVPVDALQIVSSEDATLQEDHPRTRATPPASYLKYA